jgi:spore maturation protein CgeB
MTRPTISFFGSSLVSAYWNGAATYYRGIIRALDARGYRVTFYEPDAYERQAHRDMPDPEWARVVVYPATLEGVAGALEEGLRADIVIKASGVGVFDPHLEAAVVNAPRSTQLRIFWDVDAPATLERLISNACDPFLSLIPQYDAVLTYGGGDRVAHAYRALGAKTCLPVYNGLDAETHHPAPRDARFRAHLAFLGNRLPDREERVDRFFLDTARQLPAYQFLLGGNGWGDKALPSNVAYVGHIYTHDHNAFNCTPLAVLNISRNSMARYGFSPATRVFEAAGAGACVITDAWDGIDQFFEPGTEVLLAHNGEHVVAHLRRLSPLVARQIGQAALRRVLAEHTYARRVDQLEALLDLRSPAQT